MSDFERQRNSRLGILFLDHIPFIGGAQINFQRMLRMHDHQQFKVMIAIPEHAEQFRTLYAETGAKVHLIPMRSLSREKGQMLRNAFESARALATLIHSEQVDIIFTSAYRTGLLGAIVKLLTGVKHVWRMCDITTPRMIKIMSFVPDAVTCVSHAVYDTFAGWPRRRFRVIYSGIDAEKLSTEQLATRRQAIRDELGIPQDAFIIGTVANLQYWKGFHVTVDAFARICERLPEIHLVHIGGEVPGYDDYARKINKQIAPLVSSGRCPTRS